MIFMKKNGMFIICIIGFLLTVTVGYAAFSDKIVINGTATAKGNFDLEFTTASVIKEVGSTNTVATISEDKDSLSINVPMLEYPGAYSQISITVTNKGSIPAKLISVEENGLNANPNITISYSGLNEIKDIIINQNETHTFDVKVMWNANSITPAKNVNFSLKLNYTQATL